MAPDTHLGKLLLRTRLEWQRCGMGLTGEPVDPHFLQLARKLVPQYTMVSLPRLKKLYELGAMLAQDGPDGAVVECGVWNGGSSAMMAAGIHAQGKVRPFWLFDSFEGLPEPTDKDDAVVRESYFPGWCTGAVDRVEEAHHHAGTPESTLQIIPGWFDETVARHADAIGPIALLHIDADWYDSVYTVLESLYAQVVPGGVVVIDDYGSWSGCRKAVHAYFGEEIVVALGLQKIDGNAVYFYKP